MLDETIETKSDFDITSKSIFSSEDISFLNKILFNIIIIQNINFDYFN